MTTRAAITVHRPRAEIRQLWESPEHRPEYVAAANAAVSFKDAPGDRGTEIHVDLERDARRQARRGGAEADRRRAAGEGQGRPAALQAATSRRARSRARTATPGGRARRAQAQAAPGAAARRRASSRRWVRDEGQRLVGPQHGPGRERPRPEDPQRPRRDREDHVDRDLRLGPAPLRRLHPDDEEGRHPRPRVHGRGRRDRPRRREPRGRRPRRRPVPDRLRQLLVVPARAVLRLRELQPERGDRREDVRPPDGRASSATRTSPAATPAARPSTRACPFADVGPIKIEDDLPDEQVLFLSDIFPTGYMGADFCDITGGEVIAVFGAGPVGQFAIASAVMLGAER